MQLPEVIEKVSRLSEGLDEVRSSRKTIGLVPTMGALHAGHVSLLKRARSENDYVVASIFVNPLQFNQDDDLHNYPRTFTQDLHTCAECGVDLVFAPAASEIYPAEPLTFVDVPALEEHLCAPFRPGHFRGVATVVLKLFNLVQPNKAYFGRKDAQQLAVIQRMVKDLNVPVSVVPVDTVREPDGLALSSRNKGLTAEERRTAPVLYRALYRVIELLNAGERSVESIRQQTLPIFRQHPNVRVEYFELVDPDSLVPVAEVNDPVLIAGAIWLGRTRLIDNVSFPSSSDRVLSFKVENRTKYLVG